FDPHGDGTLMADLVRYALPLGPLGAAAHAAFIRRDLERIFDFRQRRTALLLARGREPRGGGYFTK
ncbi:MAG: CDP-paratose 2-epimerase, partial [Actinomycetota bacterium]|nr:CDP-paratose 2-epimerase [Actinomycetota bacterium]